MSAWLPDEYMDECPPNLRPSPNDWIECGGDGWRLAPPEDAEPDHFGPRPLAHGDTVSFMTLVLHGSVDVMISASGEHSAAGEAPEGECYWDGDDMDTMAHSFDAFVRDYAGNMRAGSTELVTCSVYSWPSTAFRFVVDGGTARFEPVAAEGAAS